MNKIFFVGLVIGFAWNSQALPSHFNSQKVFPETPAYHGEFPHQIVLLRGGGFYCTGSLFGPDKVVTASHCTPTSASYTVRAGDYDLSRDDNTEQLRTVIRIVNHPGYDASTLANDISVLTLSSPFDLNEYIQPIALPPINFVASGSGVVSGWWGETSRVLMKATVTIIDCQNAYGSDYYDTPSLCVEEAASCQQSNSGGPLIQDINGRRSIIGLTSWGFGCNRPGYPLAFVDVAKYINFLESN